MAKQKGALRGSRYIVLLVLVLVYALNYTDRQLIGILSIYIKRDLHLTDSQLGIMGGLAFAALYSVLGVPVARVADQHNRTRLIGAAVVLWSLFTSACSLAVGFWSLFLCRLGVGIGEAGGAAPSYSLVSDYFPPRERGRAMSVLTLALPMGTAAGLVVGGFLATRFGWRTAFLLVGAIGVIVAPLMFWLSEPERGRLDGVSPSSADRLPSLSAVLTVLFKKPAFWLLSLAGGTAGMMGYGTAFWLPAFLHRTRGFDVSQISALLSGATLVGGFIGIMSAGWLADWLGRRWRAAYALIPAALLSLALPFLLLALDASNRMLILALVAVPLGAHMGISGCSVVITQHLTGPFMRTTSAAIVLLIWNLVGLGGGTALLGFLSDELVPRFGVQALRYSITYCALILYPVTVSLYLATAWRLKTDWVEGAAAQKANRAGR